MDEYIKRQAAIEAAMKDASQKRTQEFNGGCARAANNIKRIPAADVAEVRHGEWVLSVYTVDIPDTRRWHEWHCSNCGYVRKAGWENTEGGRKPDAKYCEHCMAKMDGGAQ